MALFGKKSAKAEASRRRVQTDIEALKLSVLNALKKRSATSVSLVGLTPGAGATSVASRLAMALARGGRKVILVGSHEGRPGLGDLFGIGSSVQGHEAGQALELRERVVASDHPNLRLLAIPELEFSALGLSPEQWREQFAELAEEGIVVTDAGSISSPGSMILAVAAGATVLVLHSGSSSRKQLESAERRMVASGVELIGVVVNKRRYFVPDFIYRRL